MAEPATSLAFADLAPRDQISLILSAIGGETIAFYPRFVDLFGDVKTALFAGQLLYWQRIVLQKGVEPGGWVWKSQEAWEAETMLTRRHLETASRRLIAKQYLETLQPKRFGPLYYRLALDRMGMDLASLVGMEFEGQDFTKADVLAACLGKPKSFNRLLAQVTGSIPAGMMLSQFMSWYRGQSTGGRMPIWIESPVELIERETRLSRRQQEHARGQLRQLALIEEYLVQLRSPKLRLRVIFDNLAALLLAQGHGADVFPTDGVFVDSMLNPQKRHRGIVDKSFESTKAPSSNCVELVESTKTPTGVDGFFVDSIGGFVDSNGAFVDSHYKNKNTLKITTTTTACASAKVDVVVSEDLIFPQGIADAAKRALRQILQAAPEGLRQTLLDELQGALANGHVVKNPIGYVRALTVRACSGQFEPEKALAVAEARQRRKAEAASAKRRVEEAALRQVEATSPEVQEQLAQVRERVLSQFRKGKGGSQ